MFHSYFNKYAFDDIFNVLINPIDNSQKILLLYIYKQFLIVQINIFVENRGKSTGSHKKSNQIFY